MQRRHPVMGCETRGHCPDFHFCDGQRSSPAFLLGQMGLDPRTGSSCLPRSGPPVPHTAPHHPGSTLSPLALTPPHPPGLLKGATQPGT